MKKIGLVLASSPGYSETFFRNKIAVLHKAGFDVFLFSDRVTADVEHCRQFRGYVLPSTFVWRLVKVMCVVAWTFLRVPRRVITFVRMELNEGVTSSSALRNLYLSAHILPYTLDWLHFGFVTMAVGRENVARTIHAKMGVSFRGYDVSIYPLKHPGVYDRVWTKVDKVHSISDYLYGLALSLGLSDNVPMMKITPAIRASDFILIDEHRAIEGPIQIITTARLHWIKGIDVSLVAMKLLKNKGIEFHLNIMGDGEEYEKLMYLRSILDLQKEVTFHGKMPYKELLEWLKKSDMYIQPSIQEGFCNSVLEAQASGLLCIVSNAEGLSENVLDQKTGWVIPKLNPEALAKKIEEVMVLSEERKQEIRRGAMERIKAEFTMDHHEHLFPLFFN